MLADRLSLLASSLPARAAGLWRIDRDALHLVSFWSHPDLSPEVASAFSAATRLVPLTAPGLAIARAASERSPIVSLRASLPSDHGSGLWLTRFAADRSIAVPLYLPDSGDFVLSVALGSSSLADSAVIAAILSFAESHAAPPTA